MNIYDAINFSKNAWNSVSQQTISNCWKHTGILPQNEIDEMDDEIEDSDDQEKFFNEMEMQELIYKLPFDDFMSTEDFLHVDDSLKNNGGLTDDEIVAIVKLNNSESTTDQNERPLKLILKKEALGHLNDLVLFFEYSLDISINSDELNILKKLRCQVLTLHINNAKQTTLDSFIQ